MSNVVLVKAMIIKDDLTYKEACSLLKKANKSEAAEDISFGITSGKGDGWILFGEVKSLIQKFIVDPEKYIINGDFK